MRRLFFSIFFVLIGGGAYIIYGPVGIYHPQNFDHDVIFVLEKGQSTQNIAENLTAAKLAPHPIIFYAAGFLSHNLHRLKAGEYRIPAHASPWEIVSILASGKSIVHKITIPEGTTVHEIMNIVQQTEALVGSISKIPDEGTLLPETYTYTRGDTRDSIIMRMEKEMRLVLKNSWANRQEKLPLVSPEQALILASIVEKETGVATERAHVAGVFINRLRIGMKLQSDPTVIYGLTQGKERLNRPLSRLDLQNPTDFNTYIIPGMPPKPIACPGKTAIAAVLNPASHDDLYFVADGTGGHAFAKSLDAHNQNVRHWRHIEKNRS